MGSDASFGPAYCHSCGNESEVVSRAAVLYAAGWSDIHKPAPNAPNYHEWTCPDCNEKKARP